MLVRRYYCFERYKKIVLKRYILYANPFKLSRDMDSLLKMVDKYDGSDDIITWLEKLSMLKQLRRVKEPLHELIPIFLVGDPYVWYQQQSCATKESSELLVAALKKAFGMDSFDAFNKLRTLRWKPGDSVEIYLSTLKRLASACDITDQSFILHSFITGLPEEASSQLRTQVKISATPLPDLVEKARIILKDQQEKVISMPMPSASHVRGKCRRCGGFGHDARTCRIEDDPVRTGPLFRQIVCYRCGERGHIAAKCRNPLRQSFKTCTSCGKVGHIAAYCNVLSENDAGKSSAPVTFPEEE